MSIIIMLVQCFEQQGRCFTDFHYYHLMSAAENKMDKVINLQMGGTVDMSSACHSDCQRSLHQVPHPQTAPCSPYQIINTVKNGTKLMTNDWKQNSICTAQNHKISWTAADQGLCLGRGGEGMVKASSDHYLWDVFQTQSSRIITLTFSTILGLLHTQTGFF